MRSVTLWTLTAVGLLALAGCNKAESPDKVQHDVSKASQKAADSDAKAANKLAAADDAANKDMANAEQKADTRTMNAAADAVVSEAEGDRKVAYAKCESLGGDAQKDCRKNADANYEAVKSKVKALKSGAE